MLAAPLQIISTRLFLQKSLSHFCHINVADKFYGTQKKNASSRKPAAGKINLSVFCTNFLLEFLVVKSQCQNCFFVSIPQKTFNFIVWLGPFLSIEIGDC